MSRLRRSSSPLRVAHVCAIIGGASACATPLAPRDLRGTASASAHAGASHRSSSHAKSLQRWAQVGKSGRARLSHKVTQRRVCVAARWFDPGSTPNGPQMEPVSPKSKRFGPFESAQAPNLGPGMRASDARSPADTPEACESPNLGMRVDLVDRVSHSSGFGGRRVGRTRLAAPSRLHGVRC